MLVFSEFGKTKIYIRKIIIILPSNVDAGAENTGRHHLISLQVGKYLYESKQKPKFE